MGDKVKGLVSGYIEELEGKAGKKDSKPVTFSMRLSEWDHDRLVWLAEGLGVNKTPLAEKLLRAALDEAIGQYAEWAAPEDPEGFLEASLAGIERSGKGPGSRREPGPPHGPPHGPLHGSRKKPPSKPGPPKRGR